MNINQHTTPEKLERYSFLWSEARLAIAAVALLIGGVPPLLAYNPFPGLYGPVSSILQLSWLVSGAAAVYMIYRFKNNGMRVFGGKAQYDLYAFYVCVISGINLGLTGLLDQNIGMSISMNQGLFKVVALLYVVSGIHLWKRWKASGERLFQ